MNVKQALETIQYTDNNEAILSQCAWCQPKETWTNEASEVLAEYRKVLKHVISHSICKSCLDKQEDEIDRMEETQVIKTEK